MSGQAAISAASRGCGVLLLGIPLMRSNIYIFMSPSALPRPQGVYRFMRERDGAHTFAAMRANWMPGGQSKRLSPKINLQGNPPTLRVDGGSPRAELPASRRAAGSAAPGRSIMADTATRQVQDHASNCRIRNRPLLPDNQLHINKSRILKVELTIILQGGEHDRAQANAVRRVNSPLVDDHAWRWAGAPLRLLTRWRAGRLSVPGSQMRQRCALHASGILAHSGNAADAVTDASRVTPATITGWTN